MEMVVHSSQTSFTEPEFDIRKTTLFFPTEEHFFTAEMMQ